MHVNARLEDIDFSSCRILSGLHRVRTADDHSTILGRILPGSFRKKFEDRTADDHGCCFNAGSRECTEILEIEIDKESHDRRRSLNHVKGTTCCESHGLSLEKEWLFLGLNVEARKVKGHVSFLALVIRFLVLEPTLEFGPLETKFFRIIQDGFESTKLANGRFGHAVVGPLAGNGKLKEVRLAWIIRNGFEILVLFATDGIAIDVAKGIKGIHDEKNVSCDDDSFKSIQFLS